MSSTVTPARVRDHVLANRVVRAPYHTTDHDEGMAFTDPDRGLQWGADVVPALQGCFQIERDPRDDQATSWVGHSRHWRGGTIRIDFELFGRNAETETVLVVTSITGKRGEQTIEEDDLGEIAVPEERPTEDDWTDRQKNYKSARSNDSSDGTASVQAYIAFLPGWKQDIARQYDSLIERERPAVRRAVKYHQPFYGIEAEGWFASFNAFSKHVKLIFVADSFLEPQPPEGTGSQRQAIDLTRSDTLDEPQVAAWIRQAANDPGMGW